MSNCFVHIALPLPTPRLFTYIVPERMMNDDPEHNNGTRLVGVRALVPFGKRILTGVIVQAVNIPPLKDAKEILELLDPEPVFSPTMLTFARWIADYYLATLGETLKAALPQGMTVESVVRVSTLKTPTEVEITAMEHRAPRRAELLRELLRHDGDVSVGYLEKMVGANGGSVAVQLEALEQLGYIERHRSLGKEVKPKMQRAIEIASELSDEALLRTVLDKLDANSPKQAMLLSHIYLHQLRNPDQPLFVREALVAVKSSDSTLKALIQKGYVAEYQAEVLRVETALPEGSPTLIQRDETAVTLTIEQDHAVEKILEPLRHEKFKAFLLHGVTGSGKTLVYIQAIREALKLGKSALLLVPEIALTPQLIERFRAVFGNLIGVMHSHKSAGERYDAWRMARSGQAKVIIGVRSAIFAPLTNIGVIIVDEEHEPSYKQDAPAPRYNARDCAIVRGGLENAVVVLGSATPSLESMFNARNGKYHLLEISSRADGAEMPTVRVIDTVDQRKRKRLHGSFSQDLLDAVIDRAKKKEGVILFQNRRGFASRLECLDCGTIPMCPNCSVALTYHKYREQLRCHYCGHSHAAEKACTNCGSMALREIGFGTQRIEDELMQTLATMRTTNNEDANNQAPSNKPPPITIQRMDLDTTSRKGSHRQMLTEFAQGKIDVLLGTQMVAKGLDFARVTLVGVINADMQMYLPDFRAAERTFQLITQVSGRAGRSSELKGEVIVQTAHPRHQTILAAVAGSYELFYNDELQFRKEAMYPPFSRFVMIEFSGREENIVHQQAHYFAHLLPHHHKAFVVLGPTAPSIARLRSQYRRIIVIKGLKDADPTGRILREVLLSTHAAYNANHPSSAVHITIDIDAPGFV